MKNPREFETLRASRETSNQRAAKTLVNLNHRLSSEVAIYSTVSHRLRPSVTSRQTCHPFLVNQHCLKFIRILIADVTLDSQKFPLPRASPAASTIRSDTVAQRVPCRTEATPESGPLTADTPITVPVSTGAVTVIRRRRRYFATAAPKKILSPIFHVRRPIGVP